MAYASSGPVATMPGHTKDAPKEQTCDECNSPAVKRVQGETDSFGCEYFDLCADCFAKHQAECAVDPEALAYCDWHNGEGKNVKPYRDSDEGMAGPVYNVCQKCREQDRANKQEDCDV